MMMMMMTILDRKLFYNILLLSHAKMVHLLVEIIMYVADETNFKYFRRKRCDETNNTKDFSSSLFHKVIAVGIHNPYVQLLTIFRLTGSLFSLEAEHSFI